MEALNRGVIAVVAGFQGIDANGDITTLGRGGSDTTAVAVAHGLDADVCEIYSDVDGVYTADPRVCPRAKKLDVISYDDMLELSQLRCRRVADARRGVCAQVPGGHSFSFGVLRRRRHLYQGGNRHDGGSRHHRHRPRHGPR